MFNKRISILLLFITLFISSNIVASDSYDLNINSNSVTNSSGSILSKTKMSLPILGFYNPQQYPVIAVIGNSATIENYSYPYSTDSIGLTYDTPVYNLSEDSSTETFHLLYYGFGYLNNNKDEYYVSINYIPYFYDVSDGSNSGIEIEMKSSILDHSNNNFDFYEAGSGTSYTRIDPIAKSYLNYKRFYLGLNVEIEYTYATLLDFYFSWSPKTLLEVNNDTNQNYTNETKFQSTVYIDITYF